MSQELENAIADIKTESARSFLRAGATAVQRLGPFWTHKHERLRGLLAPHGVSLQVEAQIHDQMKLIVVCEHPLTEDEEALLTTELYAFPDSD